MSGHGNLWSAYTVAAMGIRFMPPNTSDVYERDERIGSPTKRHSDRVRVTAHYDLGPIGLHVASASEGATDHDMKLVQGAPRTEIDPQRPSPVCNRCDAALASALHAMIVTK